MMKCLKEPLRRRGPGLHRDVVGRAKGSRRLALTSSSSCKRCVKSILSPSLSVLSICGETPLLASKGSRGADSERTCKHVHLGLGSPCCTGYTGLGRGQRQSKLRVKSAVAIQVSTQPSEVASPSELQFDSMSILFCAAARTMGVITEQLYRNESYARS